LLEGLALESARLAPLAARRTVRQVHLGGGTPTFLSPAHLERLWSVLGRSFVIANSAEVAVEADPRSATYEHLQTLRRLGCNRISLGIQEFAPKVQRAVHRLQSFELVAQTVGWCRELGFTSVNFDLIYGLPFQTLESMADTLDKTVALAPDRIALYRLALIPEMFRWQNVFRPTDLLAGDLPLELNLLGINRLLQAGYVFVGLDHFARPGEGLAQARADGTLRRNFQGMTTGKGLDILGLGPSAISELDGAYAQNCKHSTQWRHMLQRDVAIERGLRLTEDDRLRRELLQQLYGYGRIDKSSLERRFGIIFDDYFADEMQRLATLVDQGIVRVEPTAIALTEPLGRLLVRVVAAVFDSYLPTRAFHEGLARRVSSAVG
jgi:oxygen-independent coproporphyrinogen-3 oxidase